jgi:ubiquinone/menaquinone biosynthesis C-methylase UbiE
MAESTRTYLPAAGHDWLLPFYDPITKLIGGEAVRRALLGQAELRPGQHVFEVGCGTGALTTMIKRLHPDVEVVGLDPDPKALARARRKAAAAGVSIRFDQGFGGELPYPEASFDRVLSAFMFHHLPADEKGKTLREVRRVLRPGGEFHMLDFEGSEDGGHGFLAHFLHGRAGLRDNSESRVLSLMKQAGFADAKKVGRRAMLFARTAYYRAGV